MFSFVPVIVCLWVMTPTKQSAAAVFTQFTDNGAGWPNMGTTVLVGQVSSMFVVLGQDSVAHMAEEVENASTIVPKAMVVSFFFNLPFTFVLLITYAFCIGDVQEALASPTGYPFIYVLQHATKSIGGTTGFVSIVMILLVMITISALASSSRQLFAFARDNGLPFSRWLGTVNPHFHVPANAIVATAVFVCVVSLINIGSTVAFNAVLSLASTAMMGTYLISIGCVTWRRICHLPLPSCRWSLGRAGLPVNIIALTYSCWCFIWSFFPNAYQVTPENFNWACVLFVGLMGGASLMYIFHAKNVYEGPVVKVISAEQDSD